jgi:hypothetical protein
VYLAENFMSPWANGYIIPMIYLDPAIILSGTALSYVSCNPQLISSSYKLVNIL